MIKTTNYNQHEIIKDIISLHLDGRDIELDPTYSKGNFYKVTGINQPKYKSDLYPQDEQTIKSNANQLPFENGSIKSIMFDPPFLAGYTKEKPTGLIGERFHGFRYMRDVWAWYDECLVEHHRILSTKGTLIFKCQDTVSSGKQHFSHVYVMNKASELGFYVNDLFILLAKNRIVGHNHSNQKHARKFHSYFLVLQKQ
jgi:ParB family chromosome partitioning protein